MFGSNYKIKQTNNNLVKGFDVMELEMIESTNKLSLSFAFHFLVMVRRGAAASCENGNRGGCILFFQFLFGTTKYRFRESKL